MSSIGVVQKNGSGWARLGCQQQEIIIECTDFENIDVCFIGCLNARFLKNHGFILAIKLKNFRVNSYARSRTDAQISVNH